MCGLVGVVDFRSGAAALPAETLARMRDRLADRGPDAAGALQRDFVSLGHRHLAIRPTAYEDGGGEVAQPLASDCGRYAVVYNGELYNDGELRLELSRAGHVFRSGCDTETLLAAFVEWGRDCPAKLRGMFAFAAVDFAKQEVLIARDPLGIKPLYLSWLPGGRLAFASQPSAFAEHPDFRSRPNPVAIGHYLATLRTTFGDETVDAAVHLLPPGSTLVVGRRGRELRRFGREPAAEILPLSEADAAAEAEQLLRDSLRRHLVSEQPVGLFLSGGVDSALLGSLLAEVRGSGFPSRSAGEHEAARESAAVIGSRHEATTATPERYLACWRRLVAATGLPASTPSDPVIVALAEDFRGQAKVAVGGEGADELFLGYPSAQLIGAGEHARPASGLASEYLARHTLVPFTAQKLLFRREHWMGTATDGRSIGQRVVRHYAERLEPRAGSAAEPPQRRVLRLIRQVNLPALLLRLDAATMTAGVESRVPYADRELLGRVARWPTRYHLLARRDDHGDEVIESKRLLRRIAAERVGPAIATRVKQPFPTRLPEWIGREFAEPLAAEIESSPLLADLLDPAVLTDLAARPQTAGLWLWPLANLAIWNRLGQSAAGVSGAAA